MLKTWFCEPNLQKFASVWAFVSNPFNHCRGSVSNRPYYKRNCADALAQWCGLGQHEGSVAVQADAALKSFGCIDESLQRMCAAKPFGRASSSLALAEVRQTMPRKRHAQVGREHQSCDFSDFC